jgi:hypothetical protein
MAEERRLVEEEGSLTKKTWLQKIARGGNGACELLIRAEPVVKAQPLFTVTTTITV